MRRSTRLAAACAALTLSLAACGGGEDPAATDPTDAMTDEMTDDMDDVSDDDMDDMDDEATDDMDDMDMDEMDMGSADGVRADEAGADELRQADFTLLDIAPEGFEDVTGTAFLALGEMTWATIDLAGLPAGTPVVAHLHAAPCSENGGPHFKFDPDGSDVPPNEVHLAGDAGEDGTLTVSVTNDMVASDAMSMVFHQRSGDTAKIARADLPA